MASAATMDTTRGGQTYTGGLLIALGSAASFGLSGALARSLLDLGWSPPAVVTIRIAGAFAVLLVPSLILLKRIGLPASRQTGRLVAYGIIAVAGAQLCYFSAVQYLSVGVALLLEYLAPVLLIGWRWARSRQRPAATILIGAAVSLIGLALVLDLRSGLTLNPVGVLWGLGAAVCLSAYFLLGDTGSAPSVHPVLMTTAGMGIGSVALLIVTGTGLLPFTVRTGTTTLAGHQVGWWVPILLLVLVAAVLAYLTGIVAVRRLGSSAASFVSLTEVIFAVTFAFLLLGQRPGPLQLLGGLLVLVGIGVVQRRGGRR